MRSEVEDVRVNKPTEISVDEKLIYQFPLLEAYLRKKINGWSIVDFLHENSNNNIALYSETIFTDLVISDINNNSKTEIVNIIERDNRKVGKEIQGVYIVSINELLKKYKNKEIDSIIVCNIFHEQEIVYDLIHKGINQKDIVSITEILCW